MKEKTKKEYIAAIEDLGKSGKPYAMMDIFADLPAEYMADEDICIAALRGWNGEEFLKSPLSFIPDEAKTEKMCLAALELDLRSIKDVPDKYKTEAVCLAAVNKSAYFFTFVPDSLKTEAVCLAAIEKAVKEINRDSSYYDSEGEFVGTEPAEILKMIPVAQQTEKILLLAAKSYTDGMLGYE